MARARKKGISESRCVRNHVDNAAQLGGVRIYATEHSKEAPERRRRSRSAKYRKKETLCVRNYTDQMAQFATCVHLLRKHPKNNPRTTYHVVKVMDKRSHRETSTSVTNLLLHIAVCKEERMARGGNHLVACLPERHFLGTPLLP